MRSPVSRPAVHPPDGEEVTIVTVVLEKHYPYVQQQLDLIDALNPGASLKMLVVDNASGSDPRLKCADPRVQVVAGFDAQGLPEQGRGSYHHALALNKAIRMAGGRYALIIDPDFFVIYPGWIALCLAHMRSRGLWFFGAPWHYVSFRKWRYFPCVHFLWIDLEAAPAATLDFTPAIVEDRRWLNAPLSQWLKRSLPLLHARSLVESRRDTGWLLRRIPGARRASDVLQPVLSLATDFGYPKHLRKKLGRKREAMVPRRWRFLPAEGTYIELEQVPEFQTTEFERLDPEMFAWRGRPFAFHLRRNMRDKTQGRTDEDALRDQTDLSEILARAVAKASRAPDRGAGRSQPRRRAPARTPG